MERDLFYGNRKNAFVEIVTASFLILIGVVGFLYFSGWVDEFSNKVIFDKHYDYNFDSKSIELVQILNESGDTFLYIRNFNPENYLIAEVTVNGNACTTTPAQSYVDYNDVSIINISCPSFLGMNDIFVKTEAGFVDQRVPLR